ncbi:MAG: hypothetical protein R3C11_22070 [Planctomycetaceae bacterium]
MRLPVLKVVQLLSPLSPNTIGPGLFLQADKIIGGADGTLSRGMMWRGLQFVDDLAAWPFHLDSIYYMPTLAGRLFFLKELAEPTGC